MTVCPTLTCGVSLLASPVLPHVVEPMKPRGGPPPHHADAIASLALVATRTPTVYPASHISPDASGPADTVPFPEPSRVT